MKLKVNLINSIVGSLTKKITTKFTTTMMCCFMVGVAPLKANARTIEDVGDMLQVIIPAYALGLAVNEQTYHPQESTLKNPVFQIWASVLTTQAVSEGLKRLTQRKRPNYSEGDEKHSFPSGHTAAAFTGASFIHKRYGFKKAILPYTFATFVGFSRIHAKKHWPTDVLAGAAIATATSFLITDKSNISIATDGETTAIRYNTKF